MLRGISIHIGVNRTSLGLPLLQKSEAHAWRMAELAAKAGFQAIHLLRGEEATCEAVHAHIAAAARSLYANNVLLVSYSGHGSKTQSISGDRADKGGQNETWCLFDGNLVDDCLGECWKLAREGARIVVVAESCFGGGSARWGGVEVEGEPRTPPVFEGNRDAAPLVLRNGELAHPEVAHRSAEPVEPVPSAPAGTVRQTVRSPLCIATPPEDPDGIRASVLVLAGAGENEKAVEGVYIPNLLAVWEKEEVYNGSYCDLHREVCKRVALETNQHKPQILMLGSPDVKFPQQPAFRLDVPVTRDGPW